MRATLADVVEHIDHAVKIAGIDAVGIGSDFDGVTCTPEGLDDVSKFPNLTRALLAKGYTEADIEDLRGQHAAADARGGVEKEIDSPTNSMMKETRVKGKPTRTKSLNW